MTKFMTRAAIEGNERLERMRENALLSIPRLQPQPARDGIIAICGYGPSLRDTWKDIKTSHICTTSGAHDFLIEREIFPGWHVEFDPRPHKIEFLRKPHYSTNYCIASTCYPGMFDALKGHNVMLWHALGLNTQEDVNLIMQTDGDDGIMLLGGSNAGARAVTIMHCLGFRNFELHGIDCSYKPDTIWAGPHSGEAHHSFEVICNGKKFLHREIMINSAEEFFNTMFKTLHGCAFKVHGDGLLAERLRLVQLDHDLALGQWWEPVDPDIIKKVAVNSVPQINNVITERQRKQNVLMHEWNPKYGSFSGKHAFAVQKFADALHTRDILDYGCGKRKLQDELGFLIKNYDPAIIGCEDRPEPADLVVCTDVLEHVEPECIDAVLADLKRVTKKQLFVQISLVPALKTLIDGRNAHLLIRQADWWKQRLEVFFKEVGVEVDKKELIGLYNAVE